MHDASAKDSCSYIPVNCLPTAPSLSNIFGLESLAPIAGFVPEAAFVPGAGADAMMTERILALYEDPMG